MRNIVCAAMLASILGLIGCQKEFGALPDTSCPELLTHTRALMGEGVRDKTDEELLGVCKSSSPKQRGCIKAATVASDIMKCSLVR